MPGLGSPKLQKNSPADASTGVIFILPQWGQSYIAQRGQSRVPEGVKRTRLFHMTLYLSAVWTQSGESGNTLKIKCSGTSDERANIFAVPTTSESECISQCSVSDKMLLLLLSKPPQRRFSGAAAHDFGSLHRKRKAPEVSPRQCVRDRSLSVETSGSINDSPTAVPERPN